MSYQNYPDAYIELNKWLKTPNNNRDTWRTACINYWILELGGLAAVW
jgi:hypothetical protein